MCFLVVSFALLTLTGAESIAGRKRLETGAYKAASSKFRHGAARLASAIGCKLAAKERNPMIVVSARDFLNDRAGDFEEEDPIASALLRQFVERAPEQLIVEPMRRMTSEPRSKKENRRVSAKSEQFHPDILMWEEGQPSWISFHPVRREERQPSRKEVHFQPVTNNRQGQFQPAHEEPIVSVIAPMGYELLERSPAQEEPVFPVITPTEYEVPELELELEVPEQSNEVPERRMFDSSAPPTPCSEYADVMSRADRARAKARESEGARVQDAAKVQKEAAEEPISDSLSNMAKMFGGFLRETQKDFGNEGLDALVNDLFNQARLENRQRDHDTSHTTAPSVQNGKKVVTTKKCKNGRCQVTTETTVTEDEAEAPAEEEKELPGLFDSLSALDSFFSMRE
jgi:hypothetical protein